MSAESFLSSLVEAAIGMAGFAGIIAAVRQRSITDWPREQRILLRMLLTASATVGAFALLPAVLAEAELPRPTIWRIGSAALLAWQVFLVIHRTRQFRAGGATPPISFALGVWVATIIVLQALNLVLAASWPYLLGVFGVLGNAFSFFLLLLLGSPGEEEVVGT